LGNIVTLGGLGVPLIWGITGMLDDNDDDDDAFCFFPLDGRAWAADPCFSPTALFGTLPVAPCFAAARRVFIFTISLSSDGSMMRYHWLLMRCCLSAMAIILKCVEMDFLWYAFYVGHCAILMLEALFHTKSFGGLSPMNGSYNYYW
jgi:hypothetical protein